MKVRFIAEKGNRGYDDTEVQLSGIRNLPKFILITAEDFQTPVGTGKAYISDDVLFIEADLREQEFQFYPTIGFESISEEALNGIMFIREAELHTVSLQPTPNNDPEIKTIREQIEEGSAIIIE